MAQTQLCPPSKINYWFFVCFSLPNPLSPLQCCLDGLAFKIMSTFIPLFSCVWHLSCQLFSQFLLPFSLFAFAFLLQHQASFPNIQLSTVAPLLGDWPSVSTSPLPSLPCTLDEKTDPIFSKHSCTLTIIFSCCSLSCTSLFPASFVQCLPPQCTCSIYSLVVLHQGHLQGPGDSGNPVPA